MKRGECGGEKANKEDLERVKRERPVDGEIRQKLTQAARIRRDSFAAGEFAFLVPTDEYATVARARQNCTIEKSSANESYDE